MATDPESADPGSRPAIVIIEEDERVRSALASDLRRRFEGDFRIWVAEGVTAGLEELSQLVGGANRVALVIAGEGNTEHSGIDILGQAQRQHPGAKRVLMVDRDYTPTNPVVRAMMLGRIDYHLSKPWRRERTLYPAVSGFLADWAASQDSGSGGVFQIVADSKGSGAHPVRELLSLTGMPHLLHSDESEQGSRLLSEHGLDGSRLPVVIRYDGTAMVEPSRADILESLGMRTRPGNQSCDVVVIGAGPAGLAAGVYAASEGLDTIVLEPHATGGQAGTSSLIRNYLGFAHGISGQDFAVEACEQAWLFGADLVLGQSALGLEAEGAERVVRISDGSAIRGRAVVISTGISWRRLGIPSLEELVGYGVFYGAAGSEARAMAGQDVFLVGAGNSAGQAALHLAKHAASVTILVRGPTLGATMSEYLVTAIGEHERISVRFGVEVVGGEGDMRLEAITLRDRESGVEERRPAAALFVMIGGSPHTEWLPAPVARDRDGFILTGRDLPVAEPGYGGWPLSRAPYPLETAVPGVFAAGDVRRGSVKRVASAVGEGATAVQMLHEYFRDEAEVGDSLPRVG